MNHFLSLKIVSLICTLAMAIAGTPASSEQLTELQHPDSASAVQQSEPDTAIESKARAELQKLHYENQKLAEELSSPPWVRSAWTQLVLAFLGGLVAAGIAAAVALYTARRSRLGTFDEAVHQKRLDRFRQLVDATEALALFFPSAPLSPSKCKAMGLKLRECYFSGVGILLTRDARDWYFMLMEALTSAAAANTLNTPTLTDYQTLVTVEKIEGYRDALGLNGGKDSLKLRMQSWKFGNPIAEGASGDANWLSQQFQDFVLLQTLSSRLRTALTEAMHSRAHLS